jgi:hypothetical protein
VPTAFGCGNLHIVEKRKASLPPGPLAVTLHFVKIISVEHKIIT